MSPRPGSVPRAQGCCLAPFFAAFMAFPLFMFYTVFFGNSTIHGSVGVAYVVGGLFLIIGLAGFIYAIRTLLGAQSSKLPNRRTEPKPLKNAAIRPNGYYRLKSENPHSSQFLFLLFFALIWNGVTWGLMVSKFLSGDQKAPPIWFMSIFVIAGILVAWAAVHSFLKWALVGETHIDVSATTVSPGQTLEILVSQPGRYIIDLLTLELVCREKATYGSGSDRTTKTEIVRTLPVCRLDRVTARNEQIVTQQSVKMPADAVMTFEGSNNQVDWLLRLKLVIPKRPDVEQFYRLRVLSPEVLATEVHANGRS